MTSSTVAVGVGVRDLRGLLTTVGRGVVAAALLVHRRGGVRGRPSA